MTSYEFLIPTIRYPFVPPPSRVPALPIRRKEGNLIRSEKQTVLSPHQLLCACRNVMVTTHFRRKCRFTSCRRLQRLQHRLLPFVYF
ncbi:Protein CBG27055 [Caenorhabditis briggsae]|uniref:Protein CBG27055 n=1 Tax=Caenorhabditis briggsae TaxID=6238 RepID=B6IMB9_CAEBR|nr:Protein CBG27055 [Caenorhabditis briggsae]CAS01049.1 Protein CBG27055 [Caenorhabditis briggsae]